MTTTLHRRAQSSGVEVDRKILAELAVSDRLLHRPGRGGPRHSQARRPRQAAGSRCTISSAHRRATPVGSRLLRRKDRERVRSFLAEGPQAVREALAGRAAETVLVDPETLDRHADLVEAALSAGIEIRTVERTQLADLADTVSPQGIFAVCRFPETSEQELWARRPRLLVACADIRDPGNAGTLVRCADAFGADGVLLSVASVDPYNPKAVRASAGSLFHLPVITEVDLVGDLRGTGRRVAVLAAMGGRGGAPELQPVGSGARQPVVVATRRGDCPRGRAWPPRVRVRCTERPRA